MIFAFLIAAVLIGYAVVSYIRRNDSYLTSRLPSPPRGSLPVQRIREMAARAEKADLEWLVARLVQEEDIPEATARLRVTEFRRLIALIAAGVPVVLDHGVLDQTWHQALMDTRRYEAFCRQVCGRMIHHSPGPAPSGQSAALTAFAYAAVFGVVAPGLWPEPDEEELDELQKQHRQQTSSTPSSAADGGSDLTWIACASAGHTSGSGDSPGGGDGGTSDSSSGGSSSSGCSSGGCSS